MCRNLIFAVVIGLLLLSNAFAEDGTWRVITKEGMSEIAVTDNYVFGIKSGQELFCYNKNDGSADVVMNPYPDTYFLSIAASEDAVVYTSTYSDGDYYSDYGYILKYDGENWLKIANCYDSWRNLVVDHQNGIWAITKGQPQIGGFGVRIDRNSGKLLNDIARRNIFDRVVISDSLAWFLGDQIRSLPDSLFYFCTEVGSFYNRSTSYKPPLSGSAWGGIPDSNGILWFGYNSDTEWGLVKLDGTRKDGNWEKVGLTTQLKNVTTMAIDKKGAIWAKISTGLARFDGRVWTTYTLYNSGLPSEYIYDIEVDGDGVIWIATDNGLASFTYEKPTTVSERPPMDFKILSNSPNPFNPSTTIFFTLPASGQASLTIYDITGRKVKELISGKMTPGEHTVIWGGKDKKGKDVSSGIYFAQLKMRQWTASKKMLLVR